MLVIVPLGLTEALKRLGHADRRSGGVAYRAGYDERITRVLLEELVRFGVKRVGPWIPDDLIDADLPPAAVSSVDRIPELDQEDGLARR